MDKSLIIFGTRPEFIKLLPIITEIKKQGLEDNYIYLFTGQHLHLTKGLFDLFSFEPELFIQLKDHRASLSNSFAGILEGIQEILDEIRGSWPIKRIIGLGDTTSCVTAAMSAFFNRIPFIHIEAGLRTYNFNHPFPEEYFRRIISSTATLHFAPTQSAKENLIKEGIDPDKIILTGNTIVDTVNLLKEGVAKSKKCSLCEQFLQSPNNVLITCHRRENQNLNFSKLVETIQELAAANPTMNFIWVSHKTPFIHNKLTDEVFREQPNVFVLPPLNLPEMYELYNFTKLIITDSSGIQEEAPSFNVPVIVIRSKTERSESVELGYSMITSDFTDELRSQFYQVLKSPVINMDNPYGDGMAAIRIVNALVSLQ